MRNEIQGDTCHLGKIILDHNATQSQAFSDAAKAQDADKRPHFKSTAFEARMAYLIIRGSD